ncbi:MAG TPA: FAD-binding oxidoreductase [Amycolatopsis sp.]|nr:FAD-binding oxidoreductase [Amycolatopsis sp.]
MRVPAVVAPTLFLCAGALALGTAATWLALGPQVSALVTVPMHTAAMFALCVVVHEASHHAAGRLTWVNDTLGRIAMPFAAVVGAFPAARFLHLDHLRTGLDGHRSAWNRRGPRWQRPLRWALTDIWYAWEYLRRSTDRPQLEVAESVAMLALMPGTLAAVLGSGHGLELLVVYLLPQRIAVGAATWWSERPPRKPYRSGGPSCYRYEQPWRAERAPSERVSARPTQFHSLAVSEVRTLAEQVVLIGFAVPDELREHYAFTPGQHVVLRAVVEGEVVERPYAICCLAGLRVAVKPVPGGLFSGYATTLAVGDRIDVLPPSGTFTLDPGKRESKHYVAIAAGIGIAPVLPMLTHALDTAPRSRGTLLYVNRSGSDTLFAAELAELARRFDGRLRIHHFRTDERDPDLRPPRPARPFDSIGTALAVSYERYRAGRLNGGRLRALLDSRLHPAKIDEWLLCAPAEVADPLRAVLSEHGVPAGAIRQERFSRAAGARASDTA